MSTVKRDVEFRVGVIILFGIIVLAASIFWLRDYQLEANSRIIQVHFGDIGTLAIGDKVTVSGVRAGKVKNLKLDDSGVVVDMIVNQDIKITTDSRFVIKNLGLMGERFIAITKGSDTTSADESKVFSGDYETGIPEVMGLMGDMIVELSDLVHAFKSSIGSDSSLAMFNNMVSNLESVSYKLSDYMDRNSPKLEKATDNFYSATENLNNMLKRNSEIVDSTAVRMNRVSGDLETFVGRLDSLSISFKQFADDINNPEGTLKLLAEDRRLYDDLRKTADNIDDLITDIKADPRKYINLKLELF